MHKNTHYTPTKTYTHIKCKYWRIGDESYERATNAHHSANNTFHAFMISLRSCNWSIYNSIPHMLCILFTVFATKITHETKKNCCSHCPSLSVCCFHASRRSSRPTPTNPKTKKSSRHIITTNTVLKRHTSAHIRQRRRDNRRRRFFSESFACACCAHLHLFHHHISPATVEATESHRHAQPFILVLFVCSYRLSDSKAKIHRQVKQPTLNTKRGRIDTKTCILKHWRPRSSRDIWRDRPLPTTTGRTTEINCHSTSTRVRNEKRRRRTLHDCRLQLMQQFATVHRTHRFHIHRQDGLSCSAISCAN